MKSIKEYIKENYKFIIVLIVISIVSLLPLPYYVDSPGGITNLAPKIKIGNYKVNGSYNLTYINEYQATPLTLLYGIIRKYDIYKKTDIMSSKESDSEYNLRDRLYLQESLSNAVVVAYKKANKKVNIKNNYLYVGFILDESNTNLKVGDRIISIDDIKVSTKEEVNKILNTKEVNSNIKIKVKNSNKEYIRSAEVISIKGKKYIGFIPIEVYDYKVSPQITIKMDKNESGGSGGLMLSLAIYDMLNSSDLSNGKKVAGTGTIDAFGNVGQIGGIKHKVRSAAKSKVDIFFVPTDNYKEAKKVVKNDKLKLNLVEVKTIDDAIKYLKNN